MEEAAQGQALIASQKQLLAAIKGVQDQIAQLEKRNKAQGQQGDSSPRKELPEPKPIIGFNRDPSSFQKVQYQEKWTRKSEVMIQSPKPAKPVLHLPQLEANRFNQFQTRHWRPGDHFKQS
ncbi:hypothetical protein F2Q70_00026905 [Brassica cretica]|uniref:Uncharacterized protein n=1 Tax=Brassica cretica TaxID=69181 RepID=A0A8S9LCR1_BRACR|nr:hypothetical protein F2Q70_00026905 [Brassica cretica]